MAKTRLPHYARRRCVINRGPQKGAVYGRIKAFRCPPGSENVSKKRLRRFKRKGAVLHRTKLHGMSFRRAMKIYAEKYK